MTNRGALINFPLISNSVLDGHKRTRRRNLIENIFKPTQWESCAFNGIEPNRRFLVPISVRLVPTSSLHVSLLD